jgi:hypothetical protein
MKSTAFLLLVTALFAVSLSCCGQKQTGKLPVSSVPVALGKIYQLSVSDDTSLVPNTNPVLRKKIMNDYIMVIEWHFEMRFIPEERLRYEAILTEDWNKNEKGNERDNIKNASVYLHQLRPKSWYDLFSEHSNRVNNDIFDCGMEGLTANWQPKSLRGNIKKGAADGNKECIFLWNKILAYETPVAEGKVFVSKFTQKYIDAAAEWMAYKINVVANKELIVLDEEKRKQMGKMLLDAWNKEQREKKSDYEWGNVQALLSEASTQWNALRLTRKYSLDNCITNYNKLSTVADWAKQVVYYCPAVKPYAEMRLKELNDYAKKMSDAEWKLEFQRLNMQMNMSNQVFQQMKNDMVRSHVLMLNIIEGYDKWEVKEVKPY